MTIRDKLKWQMFWGRTVGFGCWLVIILLIVFAENQAIMPLIILPVIGFIGAILYVLLFVKCPNCGGGMAQFMSGLRQVNYCPYCGVSLDADLTATKP
jgi:hypothetical protein